MFPIRLPALRERPEDIPLLTMAIVDELSASMGRQFDALSRSGLAALQHYHWPGNIRELRNVVERAMITADGPVLNIELPSTPCAGRRPLRFPSRRSNGSTCSRCFSKPAGASEVPAVPPSAWDCRRRPSRIG